MSRAALGRRYALLTALRWFPIGLVVPVMILLMQSRGLSLGESGRLMAVYSVVVVLLELPTGGLADVLGRRPVLATASLLGAAGSVLLAVAPSVLPMVLAMVLLGAARALASGPLEAWYVDTVRATDPAAEIRTGLGRGQAAEALALAIGSVIGGALPGLAQGIGLPAGTQQDLIIPLSVPFLVSAVMLVVHAGAVVVLVTEAPAADSSGRQGAAVPNGAWAGLLGPAGVEPVSGRRASVAGTVRDAVRLVGGEADLRRLVGYSAILGIALAGVELVSPAALGTLLGGPDQAGGVYGVLVGLAFGASAAGAVLSPRVAGRFGDSRGAAFALGVAIAPVVMLVAVPQLGVASLGFLAFYLLLGANGPLLAGLLHDRVPAVQRSTVLSVQSLALQLGGVGASLAIGALVTQAGFASGYLIIAAALLLGAVLLRGLTRARPVGSSAPDELDRSAR